MAIKITKHKKEPDQFAVYFRCSCGCEFWADNKDYFGTQVGSWDKKQFLYWNAFCPECKCLVQSKEAPTPREKIFYNEE